MITKTVNLVYGFEALNEKLLVQVQGFLGQSRSQMHNHLDHVYSLEGGKLSIDYRVKNSQVGNPNCSASLLEAQDLEEKITIEIIVMGLNN